MTSRDALPPARVRKRDGLVPLSWSSAPEACEAWPDKLRIEVRGHVTWAEGHSFLDYLRSIAPSSYLSAAPTAGRRFRADVIYGPGVTGQLQVTMATGRLADEPHSGSAGLTLTLNLNPTTTRALAARRCPVSLEAASERQFFKPIASSQEVFSEGAFAEPLEKALDGSENVLLSPAEWGGSTKQDRANARDAFLSLYETRLRDLARHIVDPASRRAESEGSGTVGYRVDLDWGNLVLQQAELYFERSTNDAVTVVRRLHDRALDLARRVKAQSFADVPPDGRPVPTSFAVMQHDNFPHVVVPLTGTQNVELSVYAKTNRRIRFEVRYRRRFGNHLRGCSRSSDRLASLILRLSDNAAARLPWSALRMAIAAPPAVDIGDIPEFIRHVVTATEREPSLFDPLVRRLVLTGGVYADEEGFPGISAAIGRLERSGVVARWRIQQKEERQSRRFGLTSRFAEVRHAMLAGFMERRLDEIEDREAELSDDEYDEAARLAGGPQWVERPYRGSNK